MAEHAARGPLTIIRDGTIVADYGVFWGHIAMCDGRITAIAHDADALPRPDEVIDARELLVFPGGIDPHCHFEEPGATDREDFATGTMSAAAGGITTCIEHPLTLPPTTSAQLLIDKRALAEAKAVVDFGLYGGMVPDSISRIPAMHAAGAMGFKAFLPPSDPSYPPVSDAEFFEGLRCCAELDALTLVHAENGVLLEHFSSQLRAAGRKDARAHLESRPPFVELEAVTRAAILAQAAGARLQVVHLTIAEGAEALKRFKANGNRLSIETCPQYLALDEDDLIRLGPWAKCAPPLRSRQNVERLWDAVLDGTIDCLVSDHAPYRLDEKQAGQDDIWAAPNGLQVIQVMLPLIMDEALNRRGMRPEAFARFSSTNAARILGLFPRKGAILPGSDADLALYDPNLEWEVDPGLLFSKHKWTPFAGRTIRGKVLRTIVRGETVYHDGEIVATPGHGTFLPGPGRQPPG
jgi:allantoinase